MLADTITIKGGELDVENSIVNHSFVKIEQDKGNSVRIAMDYVASQAPKMFIKHSFSGKPGAIIDRHLISFTWNQVSGSNTYPHVVNLTLGIPRVGDGSETSYTVGLLRFLTHLLGVESGTDEDPITALDTFVGAIARGES